MNVKDDGLTWTQRILATLSPKETISVGRTECAEYSQAYKNHKFEEFNLIQIDLQSTSLKSHLKKQTKLVDKDKVVLNHKNALNKMLLNTFLSEDSLCAVYSELFKDFNHKDNGKFRTTKIKIGEKKFCSPDKVSSYMADFIKDSIDIINREDLDILEKAAIISIAFIDIHPFRDGNGRMMRIIVNWILTKIGGYPFVISLRSNILNHKKYIAAIRSCVDDKEPFIIKTLDPFIDFIAKRCQLSWKQFEINLLKSKQTSTISVDTDAILKNAREEAQKSSCGICHDILPNVCTLCCGAAIHINCIIQWLNEATNPNCPFCRYEMEPPKKLSENNNNNQETSVIDDETELENTTTTDEIEVENTTTDEIEDTSEEDYGLDQVDYNTLRMNKQLKKDREN